MLWNRVRVETVERDDRAVHRVKDRDVAGRLPKGAAQVLEVRVELAPEDVVLRGEVPEQSPSAYAHGVGDVLDGGVLEPSLGE